MSGSSRLRAGIVLTVLCVVSAVGCSHRVKMNDLQKAVYHHDTAKLNAILKADPERANERNEFGTPIICMTLSIGDVQAVKILLDHGADVNATDGAGMTLLDRALSREHYRFHPEIIKLLISRHARAGHPGAVLQGAAAKGDIEIMRMLLDEGLDVNSSNGGGFLANQGTALHSAAWANKAEMVEFLIARGAEVDAVDNEGRTPLHKAAVSGGKEAAVILLAHGADPTVESVYEDTPMHAAAQSGKQEIVVLLLAHGVDVNLKNGDGMTPMDSACLKEQLDMISFLRKHGGKQSPRFEMMDAVALGDVNAIRAIAARRPDSEDIDGNLIYAVSSGRLPAIKVLLDLKADPNVRGTWGGSTLHLAIMRGGKDWKAIVEELIAHGADVNAQDDSGWTPLDYLRRRTHGGRSPRSGVAESREVEQLLLHHGARERKK